MLIFSEHSDILYKTKYNPLKLSGSLLTESGGDSGESLE